MEYLTFCDLPSEMVVLVMNLLTTLEKLKLLGTCSYLEQHRNMFENEIQVIQNICNDTGDNRYIISKEQYNANIRDFCYDHIDEQLAKLNKQLSELTDRDNTKIGDTIVRGDIVEIEAVSGYRNDGVLIYNGNKIIDLDSDIDEYGAVPPQFKAIDEFPIHYWDGDIQHNNIIHFDYTPYINELLKNITKVILDTSPELEIILTTFIHNKQGIKYTIIYDNFDRLSNIITDQSASIFKQQLSSNQLTVFTYCPNEYVDIPDILHVKYPPKTTLYLSYHWNKHWIFEGKY